MFQRSTEMYGWEFRIDQRGSAQPVLGAIPIEQHRAGREPDDCLAVSITMPDDGRVGRPVGPDPDVVTTSKPLVNFVVRPPLADG